MQTRLPSCMLKSKSADLYQECLRTVPDDANSMVLAKIILPFVEGVKKIGVQKSNPVKGHMFEMLVAEMLIIHVILPFYTQAAMLNIPMSKFDILCYHPKAPVVFSVKFSLAERWRETAFEGDSLKSVYRNARCYLVTAIEGERKNDDGVRSGEVRKRQKDIAEEKILGIDAILVAGSQEMYDCLNSLAKETFCEAEPVDPIEKYRRLVK